MAADELPPPLDPDLLELRLTQFQALEWIGFVNAQPPAPTTATYDKDNSPTQDGRQWGHVRGSRAQFLAPALAVLGWDRPAPEAE